MTCLAEEGPEQNEFKTTGQEASSTRTTRLAVKARKESI